MRHRLSLTSKWSQYLAARTAAAVLTSFDIEANLRTAAVVGRWMYRLDRRHRLRAMHHLAIAFPHWSAGKRRRVCIGSFEHFAQLGVELCHSGRLIHRDTWSRRARFTNLGPMLKRLNAGRPMILLTGHLGNWEILGSLMGVLGYPIDALFRPLDNPLLNAWVMQIRSRHGLRLVVKWDAADFMQQRLVAGGALGFIADQNAGDRGLFVPFFGRLASTYKSIGLLAIRYEVPIVCAYALRAPLGCRFDVGIQDVLWPEQFLNRPDPLYYVTARYMYAIEQMVRRSPHQYLWIHRRWRSRPAFERAGRGLPDALRSKLESLPWIDAEAILRLQKPLPPV